MFYLVWRCCSFTLFSDTGFSSFFSLVSGLKDVVSTLGGSTSIMVFGFPYYDYTGLLTVTEPDPSPSMFLRRSPLAGQSIVSSMLGFGSPTRAFFVGVYASSNHSFVSVWALMYNVTCFMVLAVGFSGVQCIFSLSDREAALSSKDFRQGSEYTSLVFSSFSDST